MNLGSTHRTKVTRTTGCLQAVRLRAGGRNQLTSIYLDRSVPVPSTYGRKISGCSHRVPSVENNENRPTTCPTPPLPQAAPASPSVSLHWPMLPSTRRVRATCPEAGGLVKRTQKCRAVRHGLATHALDGTQWKGAKKIVSPLVRDGTARPKAAHVGAVLARR